MVNTYNGTKMAAGTQPRILPQGFIISVLSTYAVGTGTPPTLATGDIIQMMQLGADPSGAPGYGPTILGMLMDSDQIDTGSGVELEVGDSVTAGRYISSSNIGQAGGLASMNVAASLGYQPDASAFSTYPTSSLLLYTISITASTGCTTPKAGTIRLKVEYTYDP